MPTKTFVELNKDKQESIYWSAIEEFAEKGYSLASTNNICKKAKISKGSIFQYFKTKTALFFFVVQKALREVINSYKVNYEINVESLSLKDIFVKSCLQLFEFYEQYPYHYKLYLRINKDDDAPNYLEIRRYLGKYVSVVTRRFLDIGKRRHLLRDDISFEMMRFVVDNFFTKFIEQYSIRNDSLSVSQNIKDEVFREKRERTINDMYTILLEGISKK